MKEFHEINWKTLRCAYPDLAEEIPHTLAWIQHAKDLNEAEPYITDLISNVNHQCDFYDSTMVVMYYLAEFVKQRSSELDYSLTLLSFYSVFYCWETEVSVDAEFQQLYRENIAWLQTYLLDLLANQYELVAEYAQNNIDLSLSAFLALLDTSPYHKQIAQELCYGNFEEIPILCNHCEFEDETLSIDEECLHQASTACIDWDHKDFSDYACWVHHLYPGQSDTPILHWLLTVAGTFTCPDCGQTQPTMSAIINFTKNG